ncbi:hypothetical protein H2203_000766 [Taxawa tesnikishii (nom. ined.)]|nr:hypothetical protein H2203_000766 [Dothideales sp. JES 119]
MERRSFQREDSTHPTLPALNVFDDEFAIEDFDVADGFRPAAGEAEDGPSRLSRDEPRIVSVSAYMTDSPTTHMPSQVPTRNSTRKSRNMENPFASAEDDDAPETPLAAHQASALNPLYTLLEYRTGLPLHGSGGPSHPYTMYPQGTNIGRTPSMSTTSTVRVPQRVSSGNAGPAHPYAMYSQNVAEDLEDDVEEAPRNQIPVGFPGLGQAFHRRLGPDGEEQDIVGIDGHSEQLPPYSEYPEEGPPKDPILPLHTPSPAVAPHLQVPLMQRAPESMSDTRNLAAAEGFPIMQQMDSHESQDTTSAKSWKTMSWKERRKIKFLGIPLWWTMLAIGVLAFIAIVLGAAIGGFLSSQKKHRKPLPPYPSAAADQFSTPTSTSYLDYSPIPSPSHLSAPQGTYALNIGPPQETQASCLGDVSQAVAWSCNIPGPPSIAINVECSGGNGGPVGASIFSTDDNFNISYGTQPLETSFGTLKPVQDLDDPRRGPAFYFNSFYDKLVVLPEDAFGPAHIQRETDTFRTADLLAGADVVKLCRQDSSLGSATGTTPAATTPYMMSPASSTSPGATATSNVAMTASTMVVVAGSPATASTPPTQTTSSQYQNPWQSYAAAYAASHSGAYPSNSARDADNYWHSLQGYPYVVKIEERRIPNSPQPFCIKMQVLDDGSANFVADPSNGGQPIKIMLNETTSNYGVSATTAVSRRNNDKRDASGGCHCQWVAE